MRNDNGSSDEWAVVFAEWARSPDDESAMTPLPQSGSAAVARTA